MDLDFLRMTRFLVEMNETYVGFWEFGQKCVGFLEEKGKTRMSLLEILFSVVGRTETWRHVLMVGD